MTRPRSRSLESIVKREAKGNFSDKRKKTQEEYEEEYRIKHTLEWDYHYVSRITFIYMLIDPRDDQPRYVGKTIDLEERYKEHIKDGKSDRNSYKINWLKQLFSKNLMPIIKVIEFTGDHNWSEREKYWIKLYRELGCKLTNLRDGGEGGTISDPKILKEIMTKGLDTRIKTHEEKVRKGTAKHKYFGVHKHKNGLYFVTRPNPGWHIRGTNSNGVNVKSFNYSTQAALYYNRCLKSEYKYPNDVNEVTKEDIIEEYKEHILREQKEVMKILKKYGYIEDTKHEFDKDEDYFD